MSRIEGWIGVDLDGTLAEYHGYQGLEHVGRPIPEMVERVKRWLAQGREVRIFTARLDGGPERLDRREVERVIRGWCREHLGRELPVTNVKTIGMAELWDDRAVSVQSNTGRALSWL